MTTIARNTDNTVSVFVFSIEHGSRYVRDYVCPFAAVCAAGAENGERVKIQSNAQVAATYIN